MNGDNLSRQLAFLQISQEDRQLLEEVSPALKADAARFSEKFYRHLLAFPETARFMQDPKLVERLKKAQEEHLATMIDARWDDEYVSRRHHVGKAHQTAGVQPQLMLGAYNLYLQYFFRKLAEPYGDDVRANVEQMLSLLKVVLLDVGLTLDVYFGGGAWEGAAPSSLELASAAATGKQRLSANNPRQRKRKQRDDSPRS